jgi:hypothetical protein
VFARYLYDSFRFPDSGSSKNKTDQELPPRVEREEREIHCVPPAAQLRESLMRTQRRNAVVSLLLAVGLSCAVSRARADELPQLSIESGRIVVKRSDLAAPEVSTFVQGPGTPLQPGRYNTETTILGKDSELVGGVKPRLRLGYGMGDGTNPATSYNDVYIRGVLIKEFW